MAGGLPDRLGGQLGAVVALVCESVGLVVVATATSLVAAVAGACAAGFGIALLFPSLSLIVLERVEEHRRATAIGGFAAFLDVGVAVSGPLTGAVAAAAGYPASFWLAAALPALGAAGLLVTSAPPETASVANRQTLGTSGPTVAEKTSVWS